MRARRRYANAPLDSKINKLFELLDDSPACAKNNFKWDDEALWSLTHFRIGKQLCKILLSLEGITRDSVIIDAMSSVGGNTIHFAKHFSTVIAIELDPNRKQMLDHNLALFGVRADTYCRFYQDCNTPRDIVFFDPPWGIDYKKIPRGKMRITLQDPDTSRRVSIETLISTSRAKYCMVKLPHNYDFKYLEAAIVGTIVDSYIFHRPNSFIILVIKLAA